jgi:hypothetical protein
MTVSQQGFGVPGCTNLQFILADGTGCATDPFNIVIVNTYPGSDLGAKINAADIAAGSTVTELWVTSTGTVITQPSISSGHILVLKAPVTWNINPIFANNTGFVGDGPVALQTITQTISYSGWINQSNLSSFRMDNLWINATTEGSNGFVLICSTCNDVYTYNNHVTNIGLMQTQSTAANYGLVTLGNLSTNIHAGNNFIDGGVSGISNLVYGIILEYTKNATIEDTTCNKVQYCNVWFGGDANANGAVANTRWAQNITITGGLATNVQAGFWGSMGQDIAVTGVVVDTCTDVCLDAEGTFRATFGNFTVKNAVNGGISTYFLSQHVNFGPGTDTCDSASTCRLFAFRNVGQNPTQAIDQKAQHVKFVCNDVANLCIGTADPIGGLTLDSDDFTNSKIALSTGASSGYKFNNLGMLYTYTPSSVFNAIYVPGMTNVYGSQSWITNSKFTSQTAQAVGTYALNILQTDFNASDTLFVTGNTTSGFTNDALFQGASTNVGITPVFVYDGNVWGSNSLFQPEPTAIAITGFTGTGPGNLTFANTSTNGLVPGESIVFSGFTGGAAGLNTTLCTVQVGGLTATAFICSVSATTSGSSSGTLVAMNGKFIGRYYNQSTDSTTFTGSTSSLATASQGYTSSQTIVLTATPVGTYPGAGTSPTISCSAGYVCSPNYGVVSFTVGTTPAAGNMFSVNWTTPLSHKAVCIENAYDNTASAPITTDYANVGSSTTILAMFQNTTALTAAHSLTVWYQCW